jgi:phosphoglucosamine mutase
MRSKFPERRLRPVKSREYEVVQILPVVKPGLFGTDGVRGLANQEPMTAETVLALGRGLAYMCKKGRTAGGKILIGKDTRTSGYVFEYALCAGICSTGMDVLLVGPMPTGGVSFLTSNMRCDAGAVVTASHNPWAYNGLKLFSRDGLKLSSEVEAEIEQCISSKILDDLRPTGTNMGRASRINDALGRYVVFVKNTFPKHLSLDGLRIVLDCAHGAGYKAAPLIFHELGARLNCLGINPNGENINLNSGSMHPEMACAAVKETGAHIGIALDGDADRIALSDECGNEISGDQIIGIIAEDMLKKGTLRKRILVATVMSNSGLDRRIEELGGSVIRTAVGDHFVVERLISEGLNFGGEPTGHMIHLDHVLCSDGIIAALQVARIMVETGKPLSELAAPVRLIPQVSRNVEVSAKPDLKLIPGLQDAIRSSEALLADKGRLLVRYSGTQSLCRVMAEGENYSELQSIVEYISSIIRKYCHNNHE